MLVGGDAGSGGAGAGVAVLEGGALDVEGAPGGGETCAVPASVASARRPTVIVARDASAAIPDSAARALTLDVRRRYIGP